MAAPEDIHPATARVCIDFGTAFSKASAYVGGDRAAREAVRALAIGAVAGAEHPLLTPSVVFVDQGRIIFGPPALERARASVGAGRDPILSFKLILAASDLDGALALRVRPSIDPTGTLRYRDALVLYLAYLDQLVRAAIQREEDLGAALISAPRRYTSPIWRTRAEGDRVMARLFDEAIVVSDRFGPLLMSAEGVSIAQCRDALDKGARTLGIGQLEAGVFEAHAAAAAYGAFARTAHDIMMVVDMGAGTTDIAGFVQERGPDGAVLSEIVSARQSCGLAGDEIDQIIANLFMDKFKLRAQESQAQLWRALSLSVRSLKRDLFVNGRCDFHHNGRSRRLHQHDLLKSPRFKEFCQTLAKAIAASLKAVSAEAQERQANTISVLLAGGGANLPFMRAVAEDAAARVSAASTEIEIFGEDWYLPSGFDPNLRTAFPQVAIGLGGALAQLSDAEDLNAGANEEPIGL